MKRSEWLRVTLLLATVTASLALHYTDALPPIWIFAAGLAAIAMLADWVRRGTEQAAGHAGAAIGSLLAVTFGNAAELVLALFILSAAQTEVVQAQITGSIIGTTLLFLGICAFVGGLRHERQVFGVAQVGLLSTMLLLVAIAILLPATFDVAERAHVAGVDRALDEERLSL
ncbi:MAG: calcium/proton exchanger, partial [Bradyrhizobium sp.]|nr:calcium/proton exchanger [Bradyrhizobium sp.]